MEYQSTHPEVHPQQLLGGAVVACRDTRPHDNNNAVTATTCAAGPWVIPLNQLALRLVKTSPPIAIRQTPTFTRSRLPEARGSYPEATQPCCELRGLPNSEGVCRPALISLLAGKDELLRGPGPPTCATSHGISQR